LVDEPIVGLFFEQSLAFITCFFAAIRSGKVVVPLEINSPENRLLKLINNAQIKTIIRGDNLSYAETKDLRIFSYSELCKKKVVSCISLTI